MVGDKPTVVVIEDAHWLDSASTGLVLASSAGSGCRCCWWWPPAHGARVGRPRTSWPGSPTGGRSGPNIERLVLDWLPLAAVEALIAQRLETSHVPEVLTCLVEEKAEGNPLFTEELTLALRDAGLVRVAGGRVELLSDIPDVLARRLPHTVHGATSRIDRLSPTQQLTVKVAVAIGRRSRSPSCARSTLRQAVARTLAADLERDRWADLTVLDTPEPDPQLPVQ